MDFKNRLQKLRQKLSERELDAIFVSQPENRCYLCGFNGSSGYLLITPQDSILATDFRYTEQAKRQAPDYEIFKITGETTEWFPKLIGEFNFKKLGFEAGHITFTLHRQLSDILDKAPSPPGLIPTEGLVESIRAVKEPEETELITKAVELTNNAVEYIRDIILVGMTEREVAWEIEKFLRQNGSEPVPFDLIVASGPNAARPHARASLRTIGAGEPVLIDIGAKFNGYCSDLSRTFCLGADDTFHKVYNIVLEAQQTAIDAIREGMTGGQAHSLAAKVIEQAGYGEAFGHGLGHGIGLALHEPPRLGLNSNEILTEGMVFTIEPGIYLSGWGGVRIEDVAILEGGTIRLISKARK